MRLIFISLAWVFSANAHAQTLVLQPNGASGKDAMISSGNPNTNYGNSTEFNASAWDVSGMSVNVIQRSLIQFDLSAIPPGSTISSATLTLYHDSNSDFESGYHHSDDDNSGLIMKIASNWNENTVTWNTQPSTTSDFIFVSASTSFTQDYGFDIKYIVQQWINNPATNHGLMLLLMNEEYYECLLFASSDNTDPSNRPKLVINYTTVGINEEKNALAKTFMAPNILTQQATIDVNAEDLHNMTIRVTDLSGKTINLPYSISGNQIVVNRGDAAAGLYTYQLLQDEKLYSTGKFVIQ